MVNRPPSLSLTPLIIPADQPSHGAVHKVSQTPPPPAPPPNASPRSGFKSRGEGAAGISRQSSHSHISRLRDLKASSNPQTPTLSPLNLGGLSSPIVKKPPAPAGQARAYAAYARSMRRGSAPTPLSGVHPPPKMIKVVKVEGPIGTGPRQHRGAGGALRAGSSRPSVPPRQTRAAPISRTTASLVSAHAQQGTVALCR